MIVFSDQFCLRSFSLIEITLLFMLWNAYCQIISIVVIVVVLAANDRCTNKEHSFWITNLLSHLSGLQIFLISNRTLQFAWIDFFFLLLVFDVLIQRGMSREQEHRQKKKKSKLKATENLKISVNFVLSFKIVNKINIYFSLFHSLLFWLFSVACFFFFF